MTKIITTTDGPVRTVRLNRAEKRNALDTEMLAALAEAFERPPGPGERVAVIRAEGPVFCAGMDLREREQNVGRTSAIEPVLHAVEQYALPVVAVVQGDAIAGGNELALHCDLVVASEKARFGMSLAQIGLAPSFFLTQKLLEVAGPVGTREILLLGEPLLASRMHALGLIARVAPETELEETARALIDRLATNAPLSLRAMKQGILRGMAFREGIEHSDVDTLAAEARRSDDAREGIRARLEKRKARFSGR